MDPDLPAHLDAWRGELGRDQSDRPDPGSHGVPQRLGLRRQPGVHQVLWPGRGAPGMSGFRPCRSGGQAVFAFHQVFQHATGVPIGSSLQQVGAALQCGAHTRAGDARQHAVIGGYMRHRQAHRKPGSACAHAIAGVEHRDRPAATRQAAGHCGAREPRTEHQRRSALPGRKRDTSASAGRPCGLENGFEPMGFGRQTLGPGHTEATLRQCLAHAAPHAPAGQPGARPAQAGHGLQGVPGPHFRVHCWVEAIEKNAVGSHVDLAQHRLHRADTQGQMDSALLKDQTVNAGQQAAPSRGQLGRQSLQGRPGLDAAHDVLWRDWPGFHRGEKKPVGSVRVLLPCMPGGQKTQAQAKSGLQHMPLAMALPGQRLIRR